MESNLLNKTCQLNIKQNKNTQIDQKNTYFKLLNVN